MHADVPMTEVVDYRARYYDPAIGRFISEDPMRFYSGANFYQYSNDSPTNWVDPLGLSAKDVQLLLQIYRNAVDRMNKNGERFKGTGPWAGRWNDLNWHKYPWGKKYKSCNEQADTVKSDMDGRKYDANWTFDVVKVDDGWGWALMAKSPDPNDPNILFNPWEDSVTMNPSDPDPGGDRGPE